MVNHDSTSMWDSIFGNFFQPPSSKQISQVRNQFSQFSHTILDPNRNAFTSASEIGSGF